VTPCDHMTDVSPVTPSGSGCGPCLELGDRWVHLRMCVTCGAVRCCDSSPNRHATAHNHETQHPVIRSFEPGETWWWCYPDELFVPSIADEPAVRPST
jgi:uncharacterized UBP type Zn finger protein